MKNIYLIRHGQTDFNKRGIVQGRGVDSDLNEVGRNQAILFFSAYKHISFDKIYLSTLKRTQQTVQPFINMGIPYEKLLGLDELDWGEYEGKEGSEDLKRGFTEITTKWSNGDYHARFDGGESPLEVASRQLEALEYILSKQNENNILICMHGRAMRLLLCAISGYELCEMDTFPHQNLSLYKINYENEAFSITLFNNTDHLNE